MDELDEPRPPPISKLSKTPSWVMLGFVLGALFIWSMERSSDKSVTPPVIEPEKPAAVVAPLAPPRQTDVEAIFAAWGAGAIWENDVTEFALWTPETKRYSDFFEVIRSGDNFYFRSIPHLTRRLLDHGVKADSPLRLTETEAHHQEWLRDVKDVSWSAFTGAASDSPPVAPAQKSGRTTSADLNLHLVTPVTPLPEAAPSPPAPSTGAADGKP